MLNRVEAYFNLKKKGDGNKNDINQQPEDQPEKPNETVSPKENNTDGDEEDYNEEQDQTIKIPSFKPTTNKCTTNLK